MLPYPSGDLHVGHWYAMTPSDTRARFMRMQRLPRLLPDRLRRLRAARRRTPPSTVASTRTSGPCPTSRTCAASSGRWAPCSTSTPRSSPATPSTTAGTSGSSSSSSRRGSRTAKRRPSTGARRTTRRLHREQVVGPDRRCERCGTPVIRRTSRSGSSRSRTTQRSSSTSRPIEWPERVRDAADATGSGAPRERRSSSRSRATARSKSSPHARTRSSAPRSSCSLPSTRRSRR